MPTKEDLDRSIELAGELALAWCLQQVKEVAALFPINDGTDKFRCGFAMACDELEERLKAKRFDAILEEVVTRVDEKGERA